MNIWFALLIIIALSIFAYRKTIKFELISDDLLTVNVTEPVAKNKWQWLWFELLPIRITKNPVPDKKEKPSFKKFIKYCISGFKFQHFLSMAIHTTNCVLILLLFSRLSNLTIGLMTAMLFCVNPVNCQGGSVWISGRGYSISAMFILLSQYLWIFAPLFIYLATIFSSNTLLSPILFMGSDHYYWALLLPLSLICYKRVINRVKSNDRNNTKAVKVSPIKLILAIKTYGFYFRNCLFPYNLSLYPSQTWGYGIGSGYDNKALEANKDFYIGLVIVLQVIFNILFNWGQLSYGLWWFSISILMYCNLVTIQQGIAHRYSYLANIGLMYSVANLIYNIPQPYNAYAFIALFISYYNRLWLHLPFWRNEYWYQEMNTIEDAKTPYSWIAKAISKTRFNNFIGAIYDLQEARIKAKENYDGMKEFKVHFNLANIFYCIGDINNSKNELNIARDCMYDLDDKTQQLNMINDLHNLIIIADRTKQIDISKIRLWK